MQYRVYDLSSLNNTLTKEIFDNNENVTFNNLHLIHKVWNINDKIYNILKYDRSKITIDMVNTLVLWRSVIYSNNKINIFSPPKAVNINVFTNMYRESECVAEEFVEGTMINLFYDNDVCKWEIASKSSVGGNVTFFQDQPTFVELFNDVCKELDIDINKFNKEYTYSFVIQHPANKFVVPVSIKKLYLIAMYKIDNENLKITEILALSRNDHCSPIANLDKDILNKLSFPEIYNFETYHELFQEYASMNTFIYKMGVVLHHRDGERSKIRNPNYEYLKYLRGNNTKMQYQYLCLRKTNNVKEYLKYFPENRGQFNMFRSQLHLLTDTLFKNYISCYIRKEKPLKEFSPRFKTHMYNLHQIYLSIREDKGYINKLKVINYVNGLDPAKVMYALNYHLHEVGKQMDIDSQDNTI